MRRKSDNKIFIDEISRESTRTEMLQMMKEKEAKEAMRLEEELRKQEDRKRVALQDRLTKRRQLTSAGSILDDPDGNEILRTADESQRRRTSFIQKANDPFTPLDNSKSRLERKLSANGKGSFRGPNENYNQYQDYPNEKNNGQRNNNFDSDEDEDDDISEDIQLGDDIIPETTGPTSEDIFSQEMRSQLNTLKEQLLAFKGKYQQLASIAKETEYRNLELNTQINTLEEENNELQKVLEQKNNNKNQGLLSHLKYARHNNTSSDIHNQNKRGEDIRRALLNEEDGDEADQYSNELLRRKSIIEVIYSYIAYMTPFKEIIGQVQSSFGSSVASYFVFYRWIIPVLFLTVIHLFYMINHTGIVNMWHSDGYLPGFMLISSYTPSEKVIFVAILIAGMAVLVITCISKFIKEDRLRRELDAMESEDSLPFSRELFCIWDNSIYNSKEVKEVCGGNSQNFIQKLQEAATKGQMNHRTRLELFLLYSRRVLGALAYCLLQFVSTLCILYLTVNANEIKAYFSRINSAAQPLAVFVIPLAMTVINTISPTLFTIITTFEEWDSGNTELNILLFRLYLSNTLNLLLLASTYALLADPIMWTSDSYYPTRLAVEIPFINTYTCRLNQAANGLFTLVGATFILTIVVFFGNGYYTLVYAWLVKSKWVKAEFEIAPNIVSVLYFCGINLLLFPFAPLSILFMPVMLACKIYIEKLLLVRYYTKPKKPWKAQKAGTVFTSFFICTVILLAIPMTMFILGSANFAKSCDIQDHAVGLCLTGVSSVNHTCVIDSTSQYSTYFSDESRCAGGYPSCICSGTLACGPFIYDIDAFTILKNEFSSIFVVGTIWNLFFENCYGAWIIVIILFVESNLRGNKLKVHQNISRDREKNMETTIQGLAADKAKQEKIIRKLKAIEHVSVIKEVT
eukprot:gene2214-4302_t